MIKIDTLNRLLHSFGQQLIAVLPTSPLADFFAEWEAGEYPLMQQGLGWLNWLFPIRGALQILSAWLVAVGLYYLYSIIMRWVKVIE